MSLGDPNSAFTLRFRFIWLTSVLQDERTPLHWAASGGHLDITEYLIQQKAQVDASDDASILAIFFLLYVRQPNRLDRLRVGF